MIGESIWIGLKEALWNVFKAVAILCVLISIFVYVAPILACLYLVFSRLLVWLRALA